MNNNINKKFPMEAKINYINNKAEPDSNLIYIGTVMQKINGKTIYIDMNVENTDEDFINNFIC